MKVLFASAAALVLAVVSSAAVAETKPAAKAELMEPDTTAPANIARMSQGRTYFNLPGADEAAHDSAVKACLQTANATQSVDAIIGNDRGLIPALLAEGPKKGVYAAAVENCMVVKGWRVVMLPVAEGNAVAALTPAEIEAEIAPWIGAETPPHVIVRSWNNEAARASTTRYDISPNFIDQGSLSVVAVTGSKEGARSPAPDRQPAIKLDKKWPKKPLKPAQITTAPAGSAIVLFHIEGVSSRNGVGLSFRRQVADVRILPSREDFAPDQIFIAQGLLGAKAEGRLVALAVPPGRWKLAGMGTLPVVNFCLGAPSFEVAAGEVIFAGSFNMSAEDLTPELDLARAKAFLAGLPAADQVKPAVYTNGALGPCGDSIIYAVEFKGAPFHPNYAAGSKAPEVAMPGMSNPFPASAQTSLTGFKNPTGAGRAAPDNHAPATNGSPPQ